MDKVKTLPPLVYGKLSGVLEFFVDEVKITENFNFESNICDVIIQIQWWGESIPSYIRPLRISYFSKRNEPILDSKISLHSLTYEIKTNIELFKSYLKSTEVMELAVYDKIENAIIGSAFVKDLVSIIFNDKIIIVPIINYFGNRIGDLKIRLAFHQFDIEESTDSSFKKSAYSSYEHLQHNLTGIQAQRTTQMKKGNLNDLHQTISNNIKKQLQSLDISDSESCAKTLHYNTPVSCHHESTKTSSERFFSPPKNLELDSKKTSPNQFPEKEIYDDSSKILYFNINPAKKLASQKKIVSKTTTKQDALKLLKNNKLICKTENEKISKGKIPVAKPVVIDLKAPNKNSPEKKKDRKMLDQIKTFKNVSEKISEVNKIFLTPTKSISQSDLEKIPVKEIKKNKKEPNARILNYLLGKEMSKEEENLALNEFKNMSPCQNMVSSITDLCNENVTLKNYGSTTCSALSNKGKKIQVNGNLQFNLTNSVEKLYYETFFSKKNPEFEIVELLNQSENKFILDRRKEKCPFKNSKKKSILTVNNVDRNNFQYEKPFCDIIDKHEDNTEAKKCESNCELGQNCHDNVKPLDELRIGPNNCLRCKYYKKLGELDKIIESLKVFENRMKTFEKEPKSKVDDVILDECNIDFDDRDDLLFPSPPSVTNLDLNGIEYDMQSISNELHMERKSLFDDMESSLDDSDFMEFSDYLARSKRVI